MKQLLIFAVLLIAGCSVESKPLPVFEYHGVRLGQPIPAELKAKCKQNEMYFGMIAHTETIAGDSKRQQLTIQYWEIENKIERLTFGTDDRSSQEALNEVMEPFCTISENTYAKSYKVAGGTIYKDRYRGNWEVESDRHKDFTSQQVKESDEKAKVLIK